jgi:hypothetical protein
VSEGGRQREEDGEWTRKFLKEGKRKERKGEEREKKEVYVGGGGACPAPGGRRPLRGRLWWRGRGPPRAGASAPSPGAPASGGEWCNGGGKKGSEASGNGWQKRVLSVPLSCVSCGPRDTSPGRSPCRACGGLLCALPAPTPRPNDPSAPRCARPGVLPHRTAPRGEAVKKRRREEGRVVLCVMGWVGVGWGGGGSVPRE